MKSELESKLFDEFPNLFPGGKKKAPQGSLLCFGIDCKDGWYDIIQELCGDISKIDKAGVTQASQVKEKFGGLRFYVTQCTPEVHDLISEAEEKSYHTCEVCGKKGELRRDLGWIRTLCEQHYRFELPEEKMKRFMERKRKGI